MPRLRRCPCPRRRSCEGGTLLNKGELTAEMVIENYHISFDDSSIVQMPKGAKIITVGFPDQDKIPTIYALCDPGQPIETRKFAIFATGQLLPNVSGIYLGSFQFSHGMTVWHVFEIVSDKSAQRSGLPSRKKRAQSTERLEH